MVQIDAAIVRIMKTRKVLSHTLLITELFQQVTLLPFGSLIQNGVCELPSSYIKLLNGVITDNVLQYVMLPYVVYKLSLLMQTVFCLIVKIILI